MWTPILCRSDKPLYLQVVDAMAQDIAKGRLAIGEKLPPQRQLAWALEVNLSTITKAFQQAAKQRLIAGEVGRGTYVLGQSAEAELFLLQNLPKENIDLSTHVPAEHPDNGTLEETLNLISSQQDGLSSFLNYHSPASLTRLNITAAKWMKQLGYPVEAKQCVVTNTAQNALLVTLMAACGRDEVVLVNEMTFPGMKALAKQMGLRLYPVKSDVQGIVPEALDLAIRSTAAKVLVSDPTLQNPTATTMGEVRRKEFAQVVKHHDLLFIEEYVIGMLSQLPPVSTLLPDNAVLITSFSKSIAPGVRFAVIAGYHKVVGQLLRESHTTSWQLSPLMAEVAAQWIENGIAGKRRAWQQSELNKRFDLFKRLFPSGHFAGNQVPSPHIWLQVTNNADEVANILADKGVTVVPSSLFAVGHQPADFIRVSLTAAKDMQQLKTALEILLDSGLIETNHTKP